MAPSLLAYTSYFEGCNKTKKYYLIVITCSSETERKQYETIPKFFHLNSETPKEIQNEKLKPFVLYLPKKNQPYLYDLNK